MQNKKDKEIPILYKEKKDCCGCTACYSVCPVKAIAMKYDEEGFLYPMIDRKKCLSCYSCMNVCPLKKNQNNKEDII